MKLATALTLALATLSAPALAGTRFDQLGTLSQPELARLARDFVAGASYKAVAPAEPLGITGFDVGVELTATDLHSSNVWRKAGADVSTLTLPKLHLHKGLPLGFDIGASITAVPDSDIRLLGGELRYAMVEGNAALPAVAVRAAFTRLSGVSQLDLNTKSLELTVSKGFLMLTPYAGVGRVWGQLTPKAGALGKESPAMSKLFVGLNANLGVANLATELDRTGDDQSVSVKLGWRF